MFYRRVVNVFSLVVIFFTIGCSDLSFIGKDLFGEEDFQVSYLDTISVALSTIRFDSLPTSGNARLVIGQLHNSMTGDVSAISYFLLSPPTGLGESLDGDLTFDSLTLEIQEDGYKYFAGDYFTSELVVEQLNTELEYNDNGLLYNRTQLPDEGEELKILGSSTFNFFKDRDQTFELRLDDDLGQELFDHYLDEGDQFDGTEFAKYLKGLRVRIEDYGNSVMMGFYKDSLKMKLYYTSREEIPATQSTINFPISSAPHFSQIRDTNVPAGLEDLQSSDDKVSSGATGHMSFMAAGVGYAARVEFPSLQNLLLDGMNYLIVGSELRLVPTFPPEMDEEDLPARLVANIFNAETGEQLTDDNLYAELVYDDQFGRDTYYHLDVTDLLEATLIEFSNNRYMIRFTLTNEDYESTLTMLGLGDETFGSELIIYTIANK